MPYLDRRQVSLEFCSSFLWTFCIAHALWSFISLSDGTLAQLLVGLGIGTSLSVAAALPFATGIISAFGNPAVALAHALRGSLTAHEAVVACVTQIFGAFSGALVHWAVFGTQGPLPWTRSAVATGTVAGSAWGRVFVAELIFTFLLASVVLATTTTRVHEERLSGSALHAGLALLVGRGCVTAISGGVLNPAASLALFVVDFADASTSAASAHVLWAHLLAQLVGGCLAGSAFHILHGVEYTANSLAIERIAPHLVELIGGFFLVIVAQLTIPLEPFFSSSKSVSAAFSALSAPLCIGSCHTVVSAALAAHHRYGASPDGGAAALCDPSPCGAVSRLALRRFREPLRCALVLVRQCVVAVAATAVAYGLRGAHVVPTVRGPRGAFTVLEGVFAGALGLAAASTLGRSRPGIDSDAAGLREGLQAAAGLSAVLPHVTGAQSPSFVVGAFVIAAIRRLPGVSYWPLLTLPAAQLLGALVAGVLSGAATAFAPVESSRVKHRRLNDEPLEAEERSEAAAAEMMDPLLSGPSLASLVADAAYSFLFVLTMLLTRAVTAATDSPVPTGLTLVGTAAQLGAAVYAGASWRLTRVDPALTLAAAMRLLATQPVTRLSPPAILLAISIQAGAALSAASVVWALFANGTNSALDRDAVMPSDAAAGGLAAAFVAEALFAGFVAVTLLAATVCKGTRGNAFSGLSVALAFGVSQRLAAEASRGSISPLLATAADFIACALPGGTGGVSSGRCDASHLWLYWVAPVVGSLGACGLLQLLLPAEDVDDSESELLGPVEGKGSAAQSVACEFLGTALVALATAHAAADSSLAGAAVVAVTWCCTPIVKGGVHLNPAVTVASIVRQWVLLPKPTAAFDRYLYAIDRDIALAGAVGTACLRVVAQFLGAISGCFLAHWFAPKLRYDPGPLRATGRAVSWWVFADFLFATCWACAYPGFVVQLRTAGQKWKGRTGLLAAVGNGAAVTLGLVLTGGRVAMNPAVALAGGVVQAALFGGPATSLSWIGLATPFVGGILAGLLSSVCHLPYLLPAEGGSGVAPSYTSYGNGSPEYQLFPLTQFPDEVVPRHAVHGRSRQAVPVWRPEAEICASLLAEAGMASLELSPVRTTQRRGGRLGNESPPVSPLLPIRRPLSP